MRQGTAAALGADSALTILLTPDIDTLRFPDLWNTDLRVAKSFGPQLSNVGVMLDVFNVLNANTPLVRVNDVTSTRFNALAQNLSPPDRAGRRRHRLPVSARECRTLVRSWRRAIDNSCRAPLS